MAEKEKEKEPELDLRDLKPMDKRLETVRLWGRCDDGGYHVGVPCRNCGARP